MRQRRYPDRKENATKKVRRGRRRQYCPLADYAEYLKDPDIIRGIRKCAPPVLGRKEVADLLLRLDAIVNPGLTRAELLALVAQCNGCTLIMTQRVFQSHECVLPEIDTEPEVVDLTGEDDEWV